ncbi:MULTISPECIES: DUF6113 family protein [Nocardioides]|uniref:DUF6113 family protein n=1 Tax=Nocardioides vastitatis TaxID=2568655 RepID=A0ABW0ZID4_9ACTN|nr:DUF6113 family protein [Nocardioides sp.]THI96932.1 hypothetical protein E7Z54_15655 [Nocardioides sp.]
MRAALRAALVVPCLVLGSAMSLCTVLLHDYWWGLGLGIAATAATLVALPAGWGTRLPFATGWAVALLLVTPERPEGDYLVSGDPSGYLLLGAGIAVFGAGFTGLMPRRGAAEDSGGAGPAT